MTETDRIYITMMETQKKYGVEHAVKALEEYITQYNNGGFTRENNARQIISTVHPFDVMADIFRTSLKYEMIEDERGYARVVPNEQKVMKALYDYQQGNKISVDLNTYETEDLMKRIIKSDIDDALSILADNKTLFEDYLSQYFNIIGNHREALNNIPNEQFESINVYFENMMIKAKQM